MIIRNTTKEALETALAKVNKEYGNNVTWNNFQVKNHKATTFSVTLRVNDSHGPGARKGFTGRHLINACWHVHGTFFDALPDEAIIVSMGKTIRPGDAWADRQIGSMMNPLYMSEACWC